MSDNGEMRLPTADDPELSSLVKRFVMPGRRYLELLHGNFLRLPDDERDAFLAAVRADAAIISDLDLDVLLSSEWRSRITAAWLVAASKRTDYEERLGQLLIASDLVYAGQGYCVALASIATRSAGEQLAAYLDRWLPQTDCRFDQGWAMAALVLVDRTLASGLSERFLETGGPWDRWSEEGQSLEQHIARLDKLLLAMSSDRSDRIE